MGGSGAVVECYDPTTQWSLRQMNGICCHFLEECPQKLIDHPNQGLPQEFEH